MDDEKPRELNQYNIDNHDDEIREIKMKKMTKIFVICCLIAFLSLIWTVLFNNKSKSNEEANEENETVEENATGNLSTEWGSLYFKYVKSHAIKTKKDMKGYLIDFQNDKVPELVVFEFDDVKSAVTYILSIKDNKVVKTSDFIYGNPQMLYAIKDSKIDGWYMYYFDNNASEYYIKIDNILNNNKNNAGFKVSSDRDKAVFKEEYLYVPISIDQYEIGKDMVDADFEELIKQYNDNLVLVDESTYEYIREQLEMMKRDPENKKGQEDLNKAGSVETING